MIKFVDLLADPEFADREIMYVVYMRVPTGVIGYECMDNNKQCNHCPVVKSCYPIMVEPTNINENSTNENTESRNQRLEK